jgi:hypothetical protein
LGLGDNVERWIMGGARFVSLVVFVSDMTSDKATSVATFDQLPAVTLGNMAADCSTRSQSARR